jgi:hypothetical protein
MKINSFVSLPVKTICHIKTVFPKELSDYSDCTAAKTTPFPACQLTTCHLCNVRQNLPVSLARTGRKV